MDFTFAASRFRSWRCRFSPDVEAEPNTSAHSRSRFGEDRRRLSWGAIAHRPQEWWKKDRVILTSVGAPRRSPGTQVGLLNLAIGRGGILRLRTLSPEPARGSVSVLLTTILQLQLSMLFLLVDWLAITTARELCAHGINLGWGGLGWGQLTSQKPLGGGLDRAHELLPSRRGGPDQGPSVPRLQVGGWSPVRLTICWVRSLSPVIHQRQHNLCKTDGNSREP